MYALQCGDYNDIIVWYPNGEAFVVVDPKAFEQRVLPDIFKEAKFSSFDRKVRGCLPVCKFQNYKHIYLSPFTIRFISKKFTVIILAHHKRPIFFSAH